MFVSWANAISGVASIDTRYRLPSRMNVTAVSLRAQRGLVSAADVRVSSRRAPLATSYITTSPPSAVRIRLRARSNRPVCGVSIARISSAVSWRRPVPSRLTAYVADRSSVAFCQLKYSFEESRDQRMADGGLPDKLGPAHDAVDGQHRCAGGRGGLGRLSG